MHRKFLGMLSTVVFSICITACKNYSLSVNHNLVYTPPPLLKDFTLSDERLRHCVEQTIADGHITHLDNFTQLNCSNAGITSLAGLEKFYALKHLNLAANALVAVPQLIHLTRLETLMLNKNNLAQAEPLLHLLHLKTVDISDNKNLACGDVKQLLANFNAGHVNVILPAQCEAEI
jgi:Leucine-rich repeat (LRR) protein